jgi:hypothetical protein
VENEVVASSLHLDVDFAYAEGPPAILTGSHWRCPDATNDSIDSVEFGYTHLSTPLSLSSPFSTLEASTSRIRLL